MFFQLVATVSLAFAAYGSGAVHLDPRIVGGRRVSSNDLFPYIVSLRTIDNVHFCTGTIISKSHVLTAASCCYENGEKRLAHELLIHRGTVKSNGSEGSETPAKSIVVHEKYNPGIDLGAYNIAIIEVKKSFFGWNIGSFFDDKRVNIGRTDVGQKLAVAAWGSESTNSRTSSTDLKELTLTVIDDVGLSCFNDNLFFCARDKRGEGTICHGDDGGPVLDISQSHPALVGIVPDIGNRACVPGASWRFTRVENYRSWINDHLGFIDKTGIFISETGQGILKTLSDLGSKLG